MNIPKVIDLVKYDKEAEFVCFKEDELWYEVDGFSFPVPAADTEGAIFGRKEKALMMMRWIRKHIEFLKQSLSLEETK